MSADDRRSPDEADDPDDADGDQAADHPASLDPGPGAMSVGHQRASIVMIDVNG